MKRSLWVLLALAITLSYLPCPALAAAKGAGILATADEAVGQILLTTQDGTQIAGNGDTAVTIHCGTYDIDTSLFSWSNYRHGEFGYLSVNLSDDQADWAKSQEGPATLAVDGQVFSGTVNCWLPVGSWALSFHPEGGDDSPAGQAIHAALYPAPQETYAVTPDAKPMTFTDVPADAWYAPYVAACVEEGLMQGVGNNAFAPGKELTHMECLTLALRLYDLQRGGDGALEEPPEDWGMFTLTTADGREISGKLGDGELFGFYSFQRDGNADAHLYFYVPAQEMDWGESVNETAATLAFFSKVYPGTVLLRNPGDTALTPLFFYPDDRVVNSMIRNIDDAPAEHWRRQAVYTALEWGLNTYTFGELLSNVNGNPEASRDLFARTLCEVAEELEPINDIDATPEHPEGSAALALYRTGILNGTDGNGTFHGGRTLTRAECAAMLARLVRPELRIRSDFSD